MAELWNFEDALPERAECKVDDDLFDFQNSLLLGNDVKAEVPILPPLHENEEDILGDRGVILKRIPSSNNAGSSSTLPVQVEEARRRPSKEQPYIELHYEGFLTASGEKFDSSREQGYPLVACLDFLGGTSNLIRGLDSALRRMSAGERADLFVKSPYAYGDDGSTDVPPGSDLRFELEIIDIRATHKRVLLVDNTKTDLERLEEVKKQREIASARRLEEEAVRNAAKSKKEDRLKQLQEKLANKGKKKGKKSKKK